MTGGLDNIVECSKDDWKLFKTRIADWQENYMARLNRQYAEILNTDQAASVKFWELEKRINKPELYKKQKNHY